MTALDFLHTHRLTLRAPRVEDAVVYRRMWTERDLRVPPHRRIDAAGRPTVTDIAARLSAQPDDEAPGFLTVERRDNAEIIGYCGLTLDPDALPDEPELAYELLRSAHGHGYATEAAGAVVAWARGAGYRRLRADVWDWNAASRRVLEKLGFRELGPAGKNSEHGQSLLAIREL